MKKYYPALGMACLALTIHFSLNSYYGYMRDELYFIACGKHLDWGYVDVGPLAMWLGRLSREMLGESLFALRFFPALAHAATIMTVAVLAVRLGAGLWGQFIAALSVLIAPIWLLAGNILCLPSFEPLFWSLAALFVLRVIQTGDSRNWLGVGVAAGLGLLNKPSMLFMGMGLVVGLLATPHRKYFKDKWLYIGGLVGLVIASPYIYWQTTHGWATLQFVVSLNLDTMRRISTLEFILGQVFYIGALNLPIWLGGLLWCFCSGTGRPYRVFGWMFLAILLSLLLVKSKIYYFAPAYPVLLAMGAVAWENWLAQPTRRWLRIAVPAVMLVTGAIVAPTVLPILPIEKFAWYLTAITGGRFRNIYELTNTFHDMFGWENHARVFAGVYNKLTQEEKADCMVFGSTFGRASALDFYGPKYGLPGIACAHQNYYFWGPPKVSGNLTIATGRKEDMEAFFNSVQQVAVIESPNAVPFEQHVPVYLCRGIKTPLPTLWGIARASAFSN